MQNPESTAASATEPWWLWIAPLLWVMFTWFLAASFFFAFQDTGSAYPTASTQFAGWFGAHAGQIGIVGCVLFLADVIECIVIAVAQPAYLARFVRIMTLVHKAGLIPFFMMGAAVMVSALLATTMFIFLGPLGPLAALVASVVGWITMLSGSLWTIVYAASLKSRRVIGSVGCAVHIICQFFFFADVVSAIVMLATEKARRPA